MSAGAPLILCSKSRWLPAIRREHALAELAAGHGHRVAFVERPVDVRALVAPAGAREWWRGVRGRPDPVARAAGVDVVPTSVLVPGHRGTLGEQTSDVLLRHRLRRLAGGGEAVIVANVPWQWPAVSATSAARRVFDCADDWTELMPHRRARLQELRQRIGREADAVIVANPALGEHFPPERTVVVRNGVADELLTAMTPPPDAHRMVYTGTLTPRFDAALVGAVLRAMPEWNLDLYGQCQYPGARDAPGAELADLIEALAPRVRWHGVVARAQLAVVIDRATVAILPNRPELSLGQDAMKLYDYAARGRPIVTTRFDPSLDAAGPPHVRPADTAQEMVQAIRDAVAEPEGRRRERRAWAEAQRWAERWPAWSSAAFGAPPAPLRTPAEPG
jgi:glycosyltransferase involved in cell wall biosynthesis